MIVKSQNSPIPNARTHLLSAQFRSRICSLWPSYTLDRTVVAATNDNPFCSNLLLTKKEDFYYFRNLENALSWGLVVTKISHI